MSALGGSSGHGHRVVDHSGSDPDTAVNRLIAEREGIEEQIITLQVR
jgi:hypothetical protein